MIVGGHVSSSNVLVPRGKFRFPDSHGTHTAGIAAPRDGRIKKANIVALEAMGGELTWGASIVRK
jgi:subtilisin family serine protease